MGKCGGDGLVIRPVGRGKKGEHAPTLHPRTRATCQIDLFASTRNELNFLSRLNCGSQCKLVTVCLFIFFFTNTEQ